MNELEKFLELQKSNMAIECCLAQIDLALEQTRQMRNQFKKIKNEMNTIGVFVYLMMTATHVNLTVTGSLTKANERLKANNESV